MCDPFSGRSHETIRNPGQISMDLKWSTREGAKSRLLAAVAAIAIVFVPAHGMAQRAKGGGSPLIPGGNSKAPISIDAERLEYLEKEQKFIYSGNVIAKQGDATLKAPKMIIFLDRDASGKPSPGPASADSSMNEQIKRIEAEGGVTVTSKDQVGTGDRGYYDKPNNKVYLIGNPVLTQGPNVVKGAPNGTLEYDLNTGQANIKGGRVQSIFTPNSEEKKGGKPKNPEAPRR